MAESSEGQVAFGWATTNDAEKADVRRASARGSTSTGAWLTAQQAAEYLGLPSVRALYKRIERASVPAEAVRRWGRQFRFKREALDALMGRHG
ncbi:MAG TPA: excisionase family DNA-binding protein [Anaeromyxobacteraceae bacterium]|nr:excisionase family DNA-binding protein [Anaeromyxobacteraceae bacterium]